MQAERRGAATAMSTQTEPSLTRASKSDGDDDEHANRAGEACMLRGEVVLTPATPKPAATAMSQAKASGDGGEAATKRGGTGLTPAARRGLANASGGRGEHASEQSESSVQVAQHQADAGCTQEPHRSQWRQR